MNFKKAQGTVSGLLMLMLLLIILYVLLIPACDRCDLLDTSCPDYCVENLEEVLLFENPGYLTSSNLITRQLGSMNLFMHQDNEELGLADSLMVSKGWFGGTNQEISFATLNREDIESVSLSTALKSVSSC